MTMYFVYTSTPNLRSVCPYLVLYAPLLSVSFYSNLLISSHNKVYQSLALLVRWADHVLLHGIQSDAAKPKLDFSSSSPSSSSSPTILPAVNSLEEVAALVQEAVKDLVQIAVEKLKEGDSIYGNKKQRQTSSSSSS